MLFALPASHAFNISQAYRVAWSMETNKLQVADGTMRLDVRAFAGTGMHVLHRRLHTYPIRL